MIFTTLDTAQHVEEADFIHLSRQIEACAKIFPDEMIVPQAIGGGVAAVTIPSFGRKLNHIVGFGMVGKVEKVDLETAQELYSSKGIPTEVDLCPYADASALHTLASCGYTVNGFSNIYARELTDTDCQESDESGILISVVTRDRVSEFVRCSSEGFRDTGRPSMLLETLAQIAALRADTRLYFATIDGQIAGTAGLALIETSKGGVAHLYIDSTMPAYRGKGVQAALLRTRLSDARQCGFNLATVTARPSNVSARNTERAGFHLAYTRPTFSKRSE
ncbi:hypothetical protein V492_05523 [Pseudogymnoascus sp. VKM F-4246]|nr:hypothetical protein V492_05523 [Pseudogymnoascus sp. VKM F-4246]